MINSTRRRNLERARKIERHIRPVTLPVGIRFWKKGERIPAEAGKHPENRYTWCQLVSTVQFNAADIRQVYLASGSDISCLIAPGVLGFEEWLEEMLDGSFFGKVHFETNELALAAINTVPRIPVGAIEAITVAALEDLGVEPEVIFVAITPGQSNKVMDGALWYKGGSFTTVYSNMCGICGAATAKAYIDRENVNIAFPCYGARRWGGFKDDELGLSVPIEQFDKWIEGMEKSFRSGHSYPVGHLLRPEPTEVHHPYTEKPYEELYPYKW